MVKFVTPTKKVEIEPATLEFQEAETGLMFFPDGCIAIYWGKGDNYDERLINVLDENTYHKIWNFVYENDSRYHSLESTAKRDESGE